MYGYTSAWVRGRGWDRGYFHLLVYSFDQMKYVLKKLLNMVSDLPLTLTGNTTAFFSLSLFSTGTCDGDPPPLDWIGPAHMP